MSKSISDTSIIVIMGVQRVADSARVYETDIYGRYVCVVYIRHNSTHYRNVNEALLTVGHAVISNYYNEFNPYNWTLYVHKDTIPELHSLLLLPLFMLGTLLAAMICRKKSKA